MRRDEGREAWAAEAVSKPHQVGGLERVVVGVELHDARGGRARHLGALVRRVQRALRVTRHATPRGRQAGTCGRACFGRGARLRLAAGAGESSACGRVQGRLPASPQASAVAPCGCRLACCAWPPAAALALLPPIAGAGREAQVRRPRTCGSIMGRSTPSLANASLPSRYAHATFISSRE